MRIQRSTIAFDLLREEALYLDPELDAGVFVNLSAKLKAGRSAVFVFS